MEDTRCLRVVRKRKSSGRTSTQRTSFGSLCGASQCVTRKGKVKNMTSIFLTPLRVEQISEDGNGVWRLTAPLRYASALLNGIITAETDFVTDFASVPRLPLVWLIAGGCADKAAVIHDLLTQCIGVSWGVAASVFLECMGASGVPWWRRRLMFSFVKAYGLVRKNVPNTITLKVEEPATQGRISTTLTVGGA